MANEIVLSRNKQIDVMRGIGIFLVVVGHTYHNSGMLYLFHMPLFFMLSGSVLNYTRHNYSIGRRFKGIMVPYFIFSILCFFYWAFVESKFRPIHDEVLFGGYLGTLNVKVQQFINIFLAVNSANAYTYNIVMWFLPCLFVADLIYAKIKNLKGIWVVMIAFIALYYLWVSKLPCLIWSLNIAILVVPFIFIGHKGYPKLVKLASRIPRRNMLVITLMCILFFIFLTIQFNIQSDIRANVIPPFYSFYGMAILGSLIIFCISYLINNLSVVGGQISYLGKNSLIIMCIHEPIKRVLLVVLSKVSSLPIEELRGNILLSIICVCLLLLICVPIVNVINKKIAWMIGKF